MLTQERLKELLSYDPTTGEFHWRVYRGCVRAGWVAGNIGNHGHRVIRIDGKSYLAQRLVFLLMTGGFPPIVLEHANGDPTDNRWSNLRPQNNANKLKGVTRSGKRFAAQIVKNGKQTYLGTFDTAERAHAAHVAAAEQMIYEQFTRTA